MAQRFVDSFDHYVSGDILNKWTSYSATPSIVSGGRTGNCLQMSAGLGTTGTLNKSLDNQATWICGAAWSINLIPSGGTCSIFTLKDGTSAQLDVRLDSSSKLVVTRAGTTLATSTLSLTPNIFYYIELKGTIHNTTGSFEVRVNGTTWITATGQNTRATSNNYANLIMLGHEANSGTIYKFDDLYIFDSTGSTNNDFAGDVTIACNLANAAGDLTEWTPNTGSNYQCVDDTAPDGDTTYVASNTVGQRDLYNFANLSGAATSILGIQRIVVARKDDAGTRTLKPLYKGGGTVYEGSAVSVSNNYAWFVDTLETDPATGSAWTTSNVNAAQFGVKLES